MVQKIGIELLCLKLLHDQEIDNFSKGMTVGFNKKVKRRSYIRCFISTIFLDPPAFKTMWRIVKRCLVLQE